MTTTLTMERRGLFDVSVYKILEEDALRRETVFGCEVSIPGTSYRIREETMYFPGKGEMTIQLRSTTCHGSESSKRCYFSALLTLQVRVCKDSMSILSFAVLYQITSANSSPAPVGLSVAWPALLLAAAVASLRDYSLRV